MIDILVGDCRSGMRSLEDGSVDTVVTSPPYFGLRDYGMDGQIGLEQTPQAFVQGLVEVFRDVRRVLRDDGTLWLNLGDSYYNYRPGKGQALVKQSVARSDQDLPQTCARRGNKLEGFKEKDLMGIPWRVAFALQDDGWYLRQDIIWHKPNPMPESVADRCTKAHEYIFLLTKSKDYYFDAEAIREPIVSEKGNSKSFRGGGSYTQGNSFNNHSQKDRETHGNGKNESGLRNKRSVWNVSVSGFTSDDAEAHFATFPTELVEPCIKAGSRPGGLVLDPFGGSGTTALVADRLGRNAVLCELNPKYAEMAEKRLTKDGGMFTTVNMKNIG